jgi:ankyrin repeat protein
MATSSRKGNSNNYDKEWNDYHRLLYSSNLDLNSKNNLLKFICNDINGKLFSQRFKRVLMNEKSPLSIACERNDSNSVELLIKHGANVNICNKYGYPPLYICCEYGYTKCAELLLLNKADVNKCNRYEWSPLHIACKKNHIDCISILIKYNVNIHLNTTGGWCAIHSAAYYGHIDICILLITAGANIHCNTVGSQNTLVLYGRGNRNINNITKQDHIKTLEYHDKIERNWKNRSSFLLCLIGSNFLSSNKNINDILNENHYYFSIAQVKTFTNIDMIREIMSYL